jgi:hypothetical protein
MASGGALTLALFAMACGGQHRLLTSNDVATCLKGHAALVERDSPSGTRLHFSFRPHEDEAISQAGYVTIATSADRAESLHGSHRREWEKSFGSKSNSVFFAHNNTVVAFDDVPSDRILNVVQNCTA